MLRKNNHNQGFTLIEVLIALVILGVGLLGLAGLQTSSLRAGSDAYLRTQANMLAYNLVDHMRANISQVENYETGGLTLATSLADTYDSAPDCSSQACSHDKLVKSDLKQWATRLSALPDAKAKVAVDKDGNSYGVTVTIQWLEKNPDNNTTASNSPSASLTIKSAV